MPYKKYKVDFLDHIIVSDISYYQLQSVSVIDLSLKDENQTIALIGAQGFYYTSLLDLSCRDGYEFLSLPEDYLYEQQNGLYNKW